MAEVKLKKRSSKQVGASGHRDCLETVLGKDLYDAACDPEELELELVEEVEGIREGRRCPCAGPSPSLPVCPIALPELGLDTRAIVYKHIDELCEPFLEQVPPSGHPDHRAWILGVLRRMWLPV